MISFFTDIEVGFLSTLKIGNGLHTRKGSILAVRDNASLIIGNNCFINRNSILMARLNITIEDNVTIGPNVCIYDHDHDIAHSRGGGGYVSDNVIIKNGVWIGAGVIILKGVTVGENSVIASGCIVTKNIPPNSVLIQKRNNQLFSIKDVSN